MSLAIELMERRLLPDWLVRVGIRRLLRDRLRTEGSDDPYRALRAKMELIDTLRSGPIAIHTDAANEQHYEVPSEFFRHALGPHMKYSCCFWADGAASLGDAEGAALEQVCRRAAIEDGMDILELGCGWGSLTLWMAEAYPQSRITAVSNSAGQRRHIESECRHRGIDLDRVKIITADMREFDIDKTFDRIVSIEMFEHMHNFEKLFARVARWLRDEGRLFVHVFTHRELAYLFETRGSDDWMGRYFFTGGIMPSDDFFLHFQKDLSIESRWTLDGTHYGRTAEAWLDNIDRNRHAVTPILREVYGVDQASRWLQRWRVFFMACAELWNFRKGREWRVNHYLFRKRASRSSIGVTTAQATARTSSVTQSDSPNSSAPRRTPPK